jgi:hypothetical protein
LVANPIHFFITIIAVEDLPNIPNVLEGLGTRRQDGEKTILRRRRMIDRTPR